MTLMNMKMRLCFFFLLQLVAYDGVSSQATTHVATPTAAAAAAATTSWKYWRVYTGRRYQ